MLMRYAAYRYAAISAILLLMSLRYFHDTDYAFHITIGHCRACLRLFERHAFLPHFHFRCIMPTISPATSHFRYGH